MRAHRLAFRRATTSSCLELSQESLVRMRRVLILRMAFISDEHEIPVLSKTRDDETGVRVFYVRNRTADHVGAKPVVVAGTGDKWQITAMVGHLIFQDKFVQSARQCPLQAAMRLRRLPSAPNLQRSPSRA